MPRTIPTLISGKEYSEAHRRGSLCDPGERSPRRRARPPETSLSKFATAMINPPPDIRIIIDRTAAFIARSANPPQFEDRIRESQHNEANLSFLNSADPYHAYYRHRIQNI
ncbi:SF3a splicing factor complex subunit [Ceratobasidium sp. 394]|nr:SF3a splicing factor complex subunit [Ceratobasidium sp. 394]